MELERFSPAGLAGPRIAETPVSEFTRFRCSRLIERPIPDKVNAYVIFAIVNISPVTGSSEIVS